MYSQRLKSEHVWISDVRLLSQFQMDFSNQTSKIRTLDPTSLDRFIKKLWPLIAKTVQARGNSSVFRPRGWEIVSGNGRTFWFGFRHCSVFGRSLHMYFLDTWWSIFLVLGSWMATPSTEIVNSTFGVLFPSDFFSCWLNFSFWIPCFTTSIPLGWSTSVLPRNWK